MQVKTSRFKLPTSKFVCVLFLLSSVLFQSAAFSLDLPKYILGEVVVTALRETSTRLTSPWDTCVIVPDDFKTTLGDTLRYTPGLDVKASGYLGAQTSLRVRGSTASEVLLLRDSVRQNSPLLGQSDYNDILMLGMEKVEIVKSPLSAIYGSDALAGVINIIPKYPDVPEMEFTLLGGTYGTQNYSFSGSYNINGIKSLTLLNYIKSDGFRQNSAYLAQGLSQRERFDFFGDLKLDINYYNAEKGTPGVPNSQADPYSASAPSDWQKDQNLFIGLNHDSKLGDIRQNIKIHNNVMFEKTHIYDPWAFLFNDTEYLVNEYGFDYSQNIGPLLYGLEARDAIGSSYYAGKHEINNFAGFFQENLESENFKLVIGARLDKNSVAGYSMNPRIGTSFIFRDFILKLGVGTGFRAPTINELYWNDPVWMMYGNPYVKPEKSENYEIGVQTHFGDNAWGGINIFKSNITDLIDWNWDVNTNITRVENVRMVSSSGIDVEYNQKFGKGLLGFVNAAYQEVKDVNDVNSALEGKAIPYSPKIKYSAGIKVLDSIKLALRYVGEQYADRGNTFVIPEHTLVDLTAKKDIGMFTASLNIDNLFNQVYYENMGYHPITGEKLMYPMPGRVISVSLAGTL